MHLRVENRTTQRLIRPNWEIFSGFFTFGIRERIVSFTPSGSMPIWRKFKTTSQRELPFIYQVFGRTDMETIISGGLERHHMGEGCLDFLF